MSDDIRPEEGEETPLPPPQQRVDRPRRDVAGGLLLFLVSAIFLVESSGMHFKDPSWEWYTSPGIFPTAMAACLGILSLFVAARGAVGWVRSRGAMEPLRVLQALRHWGFARFLGGAALICVFLFLLGRVNFYILSAGMILVFGMVFSTGSLLRTLRGAAIASAFIVAFLFLLSRVFGIVFP